jgi:hypothetical protein
MDILVEFFGGALDGVTMTSESADPVEQSKVRWLAQIVGGCLHDADKREVKSDPGLTYTVPSEEMMRIARRDGWSEAKIAALMPRYEYLFQSVREVDGMALISLRFKGAN